MAATSSLPKLQSDLIRLVKEMHEDLRQRCDGVAEVQAPLQQEYAQAQQAGRTQETFSAWRDNYLNQVAVAWVLSCVFVRYLEDNGLLDECYLAGQGDRRNEAHERYLAFFRAHPEWSDREYFLHLFETVAQLPGCQDLFGRERNPLWRVGISGDGAKKLRQFWGEIDAGSGQLLRQFGQPEGQSGGPVADTRFLGDLYQSLSEEAQKRYALLQTPEFVEEFILDRTLEPAIAEFGLEHCRVIDPTCGSGHFLLGSFSRLLEHWQRKSQDNPRELARRALEAVHGVDINPFAVAIARFRLVIAFLRACGFSKLREMPDVNVQVATGDSLLHGNTLCSADAMGQDELFEWLPDAFAAGDFEHASAILRAKYHAVVGNPPYIVARDKAQSIQIRSRYKTAYMKYSLAVPFKEKFWDLAIEAKGPQRAGFVGMITANSFMKREFGSRLIEQFFPQVDLTHVIDTSGAYIPGHGTPTVILLGRNRSPVLPVVRAVLGIRGEPSTPEDPAQGQVWRSIVELIDQPGAQNAFISVTEFERATFAKHPWSIGGGGASELKEKIEANSAHRLAEVVHEVGVLGMTNADEVMLAPLELPKRLSLEMEFFRVLALGDEIRDYCFSGRTCSIVPYIDEQLASLEQLGSVSDYLWSFRTILGSRVTFARKTYFEEGLPWWKWHQIALYRLRTPLSIAFAFVATHNHFVLDRGGKVFKQSAPIIKLPEGASEDEHLALLGLLNSSTACFWLKQTGHNKGSTVDKAGARQRTVAFEDFWEISGAQVSGLPIAAEHTRAIPLARQLDQLAAQYAALEPGTITATYGVAEWDLAGRERQQRSVRAQMVAAQEELDWMCYQLYGILPVAPLAAAPPPLQLGERAFEIALARSGEETAWFSRHQSQPISELPSHWPEEYRQVVEQRLQLIAEHPEIALLEKCEHKRRWQQQPWNERVASALQQWLGDRIELCLRSAQNGASSQGTPQQLASLAYWADQLSKDGDFLQALTLYLGRDDFDLVREVTALVTPQSVPYLMALRYSEAGLRIRADWEATWALQRRQDAGESVGDIPVPPKYGQKDFARPEYWSLRGKLDVPKERFISYPGAEREADPSLVIGWAGWNHLQRAQALASYLVLRREEDGWPKERLIPLVAGLAELLPWLKQWHNDLDPDSGERMGDYFEAFLSEQLRELEVTPKDLADWRPPAKVAKKGKKS
jgi:hypothetical protein